MLLSPTRNKKTLISQTQTRTKDTLNFKIQKPSKTISFDTPIILEGVWLLGANKLRSIQNYFQRRDENKKPDDFVSAVKTRLLVY